MVFVHLTDIRNADKIRKSGLLLGNRDAQYKYGEGVFCVPAAMLERYDQEKNNKLLPNGSYLTMDQQTRPSSTALFWKWWTKRKKIRRPAAVYFRVSKEFWPADLYIYLEQGKGLPFIAECARRGLPIQTKTYGATYTGLQLGYYAIDFNVLVNSAVHLGKVLKIYQEVGNTLTWPESWDLQLVFRRAIPASCILRIVPLSQRNVDFKRRKTSIPNKSTWSNGMINEEE